MHLRVSTGPHQVLHSNQALICHRWVGMLEVNRTLTSLDLQWNEIGQEGALALAEAVQVNHTLTSLDLTLGGFR